MNQPIKILFACASAVVLGHVLAAPTIGQQPAPPTPEAVEIAKLIGEIEQQQILMTANQDAAEARMTAIAAELRTARIHATRGGGSGK